MFGLMHTRHAHIVILSIDITFGAIATLLAMAEGNVNKCSAAFHTEAKAAGDGSAAPDMVIVCL